MKNAQIHVITNRLTLRHLRTVIAVEEARSLVAAARRLNLSQPTVTKTLREAEAAVGAQLFKRGNRGVVPTAFGNALGRHARIAMSQLRHAAFELADLQDGTGGRVSVGTLLTGAARLLPSAVARLRRDRPRLTVTILEGTNDMLMPALRVGDIDFVLGRLPEFRQREGLAQEMLLEDRARIVVRREHPLSPRADLGLGDILGFPWILPWPETTLRRQIDKDFRDAGFEPPHPAVESVSMLTNRRLLLSADYISVWPRQLLQDDYEQSRIAVLPIDLPSTLGWIGITTRRDAHLSPAALACIEAIRQASSAIQ